MAAEQEKYWRRTEETWRGQLSVSRVRILDDIHGLFFGYPTLLVQCSTDQKHRYACGPVSLTRDSEAWIAKGKEKITKGR
jgi:hypothetical protein